MIAAPPTNELAADPPAVLIIDDHDLFRAGLRTLLENEGLRVVGDMRCDGSVRDMVRRTRPTVVIVDALTANGDGTDSVIKTVTTPVAPTEPVPAPHHGTAAPHAAPLLPPPTPAALVFTRATAARDLYRCVRAGARGFVAKGADVRELAKAVTILHGGLSYLSPHMTHVALHLLRTGRLPLIARSEMSERELDVLRLLAQGLENTEIATRLGISAKTVKNHVSAILVKLGLTNRVQAAVYAVRVGIA